MSRLTGKSSALGAAAVVLTAAILSSAFSPPLSARADRQPSAPNAAGPGACFALTAVANPYYTFPLDPSRSSGASGLVRVSFSDSPFGVAMDPAGHYLYTLDISTTGLPKLDAGKYVVWATPPNLVPIVRLGPLAPDGTLSAQVDMNKFMLIVSAETAAPTGRWSDPIMLRGVSRSSLMHSFMGHGPFEGPC